jgi:hypothetical protein
MRYEDQNYTQPFTMDVAPVSFLLTRFVTRSYTRPFIIKKILMVFQLLTSDEEQGICSYERKKGDDNMEENALEQQAYTVYVLSPNAPSCSFVALADGIRSSGNKPVMGC